MGIPLEEDLLILQNALRGLNGKAFIERISTELPTDRIYLRRIIEEHDHWLSERSKLLENFSAHDWLMNQPGYQMAFQKAFRPRNSSSPELVYSRYANHIGIQVEEYIEANTARGCPIPVEVAHLGRVLRNKFELNPVFSWKLAVIKAFHEYVYTDHHAEIAECQKKFPKLMRQAQSTLEALLRDLTEGHFADHDDIVDTNAVRANLTRLMKVSLVDCPPGIETLYPIKRNDKTSKERLFVFRIYRRHIDIFRSAKPEVIALLLELEGINNPIDARNIEKLCAQFREAKRQKRRLISEYYIKRAV